ncbi:ScbA/BarX family gamma-butyrolactone biosynthesis protein [Streptomyces sp. NPDC093225]|uniref:ScbA/BarX family gamma-butyrolactone biosynthesis protein n=1 Tax=Streptomyces sp. NPDC093225 TaxID=3366034 RepID=UPI0038051931
MSASARTRTTSTPNAVGHTEGTGTTGGARTGSAVAADAAGGGLPGPGVESLVRKSRRHEALVSGWSEVSDTTRRVTVRWPRDHAFYTVDGRYSPLLFTESLRQALALLTHDVHHVPLGHRLGWEHVHATVDPATLAIDADPGTGTRAGAGAGTGVGAHADAVTLLITDLSVRRRRMGSVHLASRIHAWRAGRPVGTAELAYSTHPPAVYDRLRGPYAHAGQAFARALPLTPPVAAHRVGRSHDRDVVLSPTDTPYRWQLRVDVSHGVLFDHPHDHVPGMVLLEAAVQAAHACADGPVVAVAFETEFHRYVEFDRPCLLVAEPALPDTAGRARVRVCATQDGRPVFSATVSTLPVHS